MAKPLEIERKWHLIDADGLVLGRMATVVADILRGKNKPIYTPHVDTGDFVVIINAEKIKVTGNKEDQKQYHSHSQYPGSLRTVGLKRMREETPELVIKKAVKGMIPHTILGRAILKKLHVYRGPEHNQAAQKPEPLKLN